MDTSVNDMDTTEYTKAVAASVDHLMDEAGVSLLSLSTKTGIPRTTLRRRVLGHTSFTVQELAAIAATLGTSVEDLLPKDIAA